jgi:hypothetical protein
MPTHSENALEIHEKYEEQFHNNVLKFLKGEPNDMRPGTIGMIQAQIARELVESDVTLLLPDNKEKFRAAIQSTYDREHTVVVKPSPEDLAAAKMRVTHEEDLPQA